MSIQTLIHRRQALWSAGGLAALVCGCSSPERTHSEQAQLEQADQNSHGPHIDNDQVKESTKTSSTLDEAAIRQKNIATLKRLGFTVAEGLPIWSQWTGNPIALRPSLEICRRLMCSEVATAYIWSPSVPENELRTYIERSQLMDSMAEAEKEILATPRKEVAKKWGSGDGWRQENQWALAWVLGFKIEPGLTDGLIDEKVMAPLVQDFMPSLAQSDKEFARQTKTRPLESVFRKFDLFYCAHNAVRSAQLGRQTVPDAFDPVVDGGVIHEKRHSLTWCLSPSVDWDDTDLST